MDQMAQMTSTPREGKLISRIEGGADGLLWSAFPPVAILEKPRGPSKHTCCQCTSGPHWALLPSPLPSLPPPSLAPHRRSVSTSLFPADFASGGLSAKRWSSKMIDPCVLYRAPLEGGSQCTSNHEGSEKLCSEKTSNAYFPCDRC